MLPPVPSSSFKYNGAGCRLGYTLEDFKENLAVKIKEYATLVLVHAERIVVTACKFRAVFIDSWMLLGTSYSMASGHDKEPKSVPYTSFPHRCGRRTIQMRAAENHEPK